VNAWIMDVLRCPTCQVQLRERGGVLECEKDSTHAFGCDGPYIVFDPSLDHGKYDEEYSARYAFLWAYGYESRNSGLVESLYRAVTALAAEALAATRSIEPLFVDCGCGAGRSTSDAAILAPLGKFLAVDASSWKLNLAARILRRAEPIEQALPTYGFPNPLTIRGRGLSNVVLAQADAAALPVESGIADVVLSVNLLDRVTSPLTVLREARRVLKLGGTLVATTPMNWRTEQIWSQYPDVPALLAVLQDCGFRVETWFDQLQYRETLDARGSVDEFTTLVVSARAV
jgi:SAM-dependent methyltransferase